MSHFVVLVIGKDVEEQLAPYHEFECTGKDDQYVKTIDRTAEALKEFETATVRRLRLTDDTLTSPYNDEGNYKSEYLRAPTQEEQALIKNSSPLDHLPFEKVGYGDDARVLQFPEGAEDTEQPAKNHIAFTQWAAEHYGAKIVTSEGDVDTAGDHKYGYVLALDGTDARVLDRTNPNKKWDWYKIGGRWAGYFTLKHGSHGQLGERSRIDSEERKSMKDCADICRKGDVDVGWMRDEAGEKAGVKYDAAQAIIAGRTFSPWSEFLGKLETNELSIEQAREQYHAQPVVRDLTRSKDFGFYDHVEDFLETREAYVQAARNRELTPFAVVMGGKWYEKGQMGWFGCVIGEKDQEEWNEEFNRMFDALPDDALLTAVDCHI